MKPILKPLWSWKTHLYYLFLLGLYNCSVIFFISGLLAIWIYIRWLEVWIFGHCSFSPFLFLPYWVPSPLNWTFFSRIFTSYFLISGLEYGVLAYKVKNEIRGPERLLFLTALVGRVLLKNLAGLIFFLMPFAMPSAQDTYLLIGFVSLGLIWLAQKGTWGKFSLKYQSNQTWKWAGNPILFLLFGCSTIWVVLLFIVVPFIFWGPLEFVYMVFFHPQIIVSFLFVCFLWWKIMQKLQPFAAVQGIDSESDQAPLSND
jgi:hypothetical protein